MSNNQPSSFQIKVEDEMNGPGDEEAVSDVSEMDHPRSPQGVDECGMYGITRCSPTVDVSLERLGICPRQDAAHPSYATLESRMESYATWPLHIKLRPEELSDAGFFYTGCGDRTICFQCSGGLKDWEENDEPWKEHARYFSKCTYLIQKKGRDFIDEVLGKKLSEVCVSGAPRPQMPTATTSSFNGNSFIRECGSDGPGYSSGYSSGGSFGDETSSQETPSTSVPPNDTASSFGVSQSLSDVGSSGCSSGGSFAEESSGSGLQDLKSKKTASKPLDDQRACKICYAEEVGVVFLPCGHLVSCVNCAPSLKTCAVCRKPFSATVRAYLS